MAVHNLSSLIRKLVLRENSEKKSQNTESVDPKHIYVCLCLNDPNKNKSRIIGDCVPSQLYITSNNEQNYTLSLFIIVSDHIHHHLSLNTSHPSLPSKAGVSDCVGEISAAGQRQSEPWETGRASMSSSLIQIMNPKLHSS